MKNVDKKIIDKLFLIIISVQTVLMGLLFIIQICRVYFGNDGYSRELCGKYLGQILIVIILWVLLIIAGYIYFYIRDNEKKILSKTTNMTKLNSLLRITPDFTNENLSKEYELIKKEEKKRKIAKIINLCVLVICAIMGLCYLLNIKHFESTGNVINQAANMALYLLPWVIIAFVSFLLTTLYEEKSAKITIELVKLVIKADGRKISNYIENKNKKLAINIARGVIIAIAVIFIIVGINNGGAKDVLHKAINICTECIGLG